MAKTDAHDISRIWLSEQVVENVELAVLEEYVDLLDLIELKVLVAKMMNWVRLLIVYGMMNLIDTLKLTHWMSSSSGSPAKAAIEPSSSSSLAVNPLNPQGLKPCVSSLPSYFSHLTNVLS